MIIVGLTGGIASGKSFVATYLKKIKIPVHESDKIINLMYKKPTKGFLEYLKKIGFSSSIKKGKVNKKLIRDGIFQNKLKRKNLEKYLHAEIKKTRDFFLNKNKNKKIVFLDIPLLFEKKLETICNFTCSTMAPIKKRRARAMNRRGMKKKILDLIIKTQTNDKTRRANSNYLIDTSKTKAKTCLQVDNIIYDIIGERK